MTDYPDDTYSPREKENKSGVVYDPVKKTIVYVEDITMLDDEVVAIETELGTLPKWASGSVKERLKGIRSLADANEDVVIVKGDSVGIGTDTPSFSNEGKGLHIADPTAPALRLQDTNSEQSDYTLYCPTGVSNLRLFHEASATDLIEIKYNGNVGIGEMNPSHKLTIKNDDSDDVLRLIGPDSYGHGARLNFGDSDYVYIEEDQDDKLYLYASRIALQTDKVGIGTSSPTTRLDVNYDRMRIRYGKTPASATSGGNQGDICWDENYIYVCIATDTWKRAELSSW